MARIAGIDIPHEKKVPFSLCYIHGIGITTANEICDIAKVDKNLRVKEKKWSSSCQTRLQR